MSISFKVFIPFIHEGYTEEMVRAKMCGLGLCKITRIDMHEKKEKRPDGTLRSLNHSYAFVDVVPTSTVRGAHLLENLKNQKNTHIILDDDCSKYWTVKPYLSMDERLEKGFSLLHGSVREATISQPPLDQDEESDEDEESDALPEWFHEPLATFNLSEIPPLPESSEIRLLAESLHDSHNELPECMKFMTEDTVREAYELSVQRKSYFDSLSEKMQILDDYDDIERDLLRVHRLMRVIMA